MPTTWSVRFEWKFLFWIVSMHAPGLMGCHFPPATTWLCVGVVDIWTQKKFNNIFFLFSKIQKIYIQVVESLADRHIQILLFDSCLYGVQCGTTSVIECGSNKGHKKNPNFETLRFRYFFSYCIIRWRERSLQGESMLSVCGWKRKQIKNYLKKIMLWLWREAAAATTIHVCTFSVAAIRINRHDDDDEYDELNVGAMRSKIIFFCCYTPVKWSRTLRPQRPQIHTWLMNW